jgi:hypothetical protein
MQIAAIAYTKLTPEAKSRVDALIKLNPDFPTTFALAISFGCYTSSATPTHHCMQSPGYQTHIGRSPPSWVGSNSMTGST